MFQMNHAVETSELVAFVRVVDAHSFSRAAQELALPRATLGRRIARLEERLGTQLLRRTTRSLVLTDSGETFYRHAQLVLEAVARAESSVQRSDNEIQGDLRISVPPMPTETDNSFHGLVTRFATQHPRVRLQIDFSTRHVDLIREGYDVALRAAGQLAPGLVARTLSRQRLIAVASPSYLKANGTPAGAKDLKNHRCLTGFARGELPMTSWTVRGKSVQVNTSFSSNSLHLLRDAALDGIGIALLPEFFIGAHLEDGSLVQVLPKVLEHTHVLAVIYPEREMMQPQTRAFIDALVAWADAFPFVMTKSARVREAALGAKASAGGKRSSKR